MAVGAVSEVLICACDTFRAGAVEQLKTHSRRVGSFVEKVSLALERGTPDLLTIASAVSEAKIIQGPSFHLKCLFFPPQIFVQQKARFRGLADLIEL